MKIKSKLELKIQRFPQFFIQVSFMQRDRLSKLQWMVLAERRRNKNQSDVRTSDRKPQSDDN